MTEITVRSQKLPTAVEQFVLRWGDMGGQWGVNRSVAQIQALLYLSERPLTAEDIAETLGMARSNVSNSIRELLGWKLIRRVPVLGDRRDHYEAEADLWQIHDAYRARPERARDRSGRCRPAPCARDGGRRSADQPDGARASSRRCRASSARSTPGSARW